MNDKKYMDLDSLLNYIPLKKSTVYSKVSKKEIPYRKLGGKLAFHQEEIDEWTKVGQKPRKEILIPKFIKNGKM